MKKILGTLAGAAILAAAPAHATNGMRMIGFGPVQNGMGGASVAAPLDGATIVSNPAGLTALSPRVDLAGQGFAPSVKYTASWSMGGPPASASQSSDRPLDLLPTVAGVYRVGDDVSLGLAALGTAGMGVDYGAGTSSLYQAKLLTSYSNFRVAPAAAYRVSSTVSVGLALNLMWAQMQYEAGGGPKHSAANSLGYGATVGVAYQPVDLLTIGASYETKSTFQDFEFTIAGQKQALTFDQPMIASLGVALRPVQGLLVAVDGQWINWSDTNGKNLPSWAKNPNGEPGWNMNWSDQLVLKLGAEYRIPALDALRVRVGYDYGKAPLDTARAFENVAFPAIAEHHFTLGAGYALDKVTVNAAFMYSPEATLKGQNTAVGILAYETKMSQTAFELGASYRF